jgi:hypothetical protein
VLLQGVLRAISQVLVVQEQLGRCAEPREKRRQVHRVPTLHSQKKIPTSLPKKIPTTPPKKIPTNPPKKISTNLPKKIPTSPPKRAEVGMRIHVCPLALLVTLLAKYTYHGINLVEGLKNEVQALKIGYNVLEKAVRDLQSICETHERSLEAFRQHIVKLYGRQLDSSYEGEGFELMREFTSS